MATLTGFAPTIWQRSFWWVDRISRQGGELAILGIGMALLVLGITMYIATATRFSSGQDYVRQLEAEQRQLAATLQLQTAQLETLRSPHRLANLAEQFHMVAPTPRTVWRLP